MAKIEINRKTQDKPIAKTKQAIAKEIKDRRLHSGLSQRAFAEQLTVAINTYCNWEYGLFLPDQDRLAIIRKQFPLGPPQPHRRGKPNDVPLDVAKDAAHRSAAAASKDGVMRFVFHIVKPNGDEQYRMTKQGMQVYNLMSYARRKSWTVFREACYQDGISVPV